MNEALNIKIAGSKERPILLDVFWKTTEAKKPVVIFAHGFKGFKDWGPWNAVARQFAEAGFIFVKFNFSHNGTTPDQPSDFVDLEAFGQNNFNIELNDLSLVVDFIQNSHFPVPQQEYSASSIHLIGHSRGGGIAILCAWHDSRITSLATWASVKEFGRYWNGDLMQKWQKEGVHYVMNGRTKQKMPLYWQLYENFYANKDAFDIPKAVKQLHQPMLIVHGTKDKAVNYQAAVDMQAWHTNSELLSIPEGDHVFGSKHPWQPELSLPNDLQYVVDKTKAFFKARA